jgi:quinol monooxygenase YgiN
MIVIVVKFQVRPEHSEDWLARVRPFTEATRAEPGNLWFDWSRSIDDPHEFVLVEAFRDGDAGAAHVASGHFQDAMALLPTMLASTPRIVNAEVPGDDWGRMAELEVPGSP